MLLDLYSTRTTGLGSTWRREPNPFGRRMPLLGKGLPFLNIRHLAPINVRNCHVILVFVDVSSTLNVRLQKPQWTT